MLAGRRFRLAQQTLHVRLPNRIDLIAIDDSGAHCSLSCEGMSTLTATDLCIVGLNCFING